MNAQIIYKMETDKQRNGRPLFDAESADIESFVDSALGYDDGEGMQDFPEAKTTQSMGRKIGTDTTKRRNRESGIIDLNALIAENRTVFPVEDTYTPEQIDQIVISHFHDRGIELDGYSEEVQEKNGAARIYDGFECNLKAKPGQVMFRDSFVKATTRGDEHILLDEGFIQRDISKTTERVPKVYSIDELPMANGSVLPVISMEYIDGQNAETYLKSHKEDKLFEKLIVFKEMVLAVKDVHAAGYVHKDIKPKNFMIEENKWNPNPFKVYLTDFGLSSKIGAPLKTNNINGTPAYMSPEHIVVRETHGDPRMDIYSLGCILYEMLTGQAPYTPVIAKIRKKKPEEISADSMKRELPTKLYRAMIREEYKETPSFKKEMQGLSMKLSSIVAKCLKERPEQRYTSCEEMLYDLEDAITEQILLDHNKSGDKPDRRYNTDQTADDRVKILSAYVLDITADPEDRVTTSYQRNAQQRESRVTVPSRPVRQSSETLGVTLAYGSRATTKKGL